MNRLLQRFVVDTNGSGGSDWASARANEAPGATSASNPNPASHANNASGLDEIPLSSTTTGAKYDTVDLFGDDSKSAFPTPPPPPGKSSQAKQSRALPQPEASPLAEQPLASPRDFFGGGSGAADPFGASATDPFSATTTTAAAEPFSSNGAAHPFGASNAEPSGSSGGDPFSSGAVDPFNGSAADAFSSGGADPFAASRDQQQEEEQYKQYYQEDSASHEQYHGQHADQYGNGGGYGEYYQQYDQQQYDQQQYNQQYDQQYYDQQQYGADQYGGQYQYTAEEYQYYHEHGDHAAASYGDAYAQHEYENGHSEAASAGHQTTHEPHSEANSFFQDAAQPPVSGESPFEQAPPSSQHDVVSTNPVEQQSSTFENSAPSPFEPSASGVFEQQSPSPFEQSSPSPFESSASSPFEKSSPSPFEQSTSSSFEFSASSPFEQSAPSPFERAASSPFEQSTPSPFAQSTSSPFEESSPTPFQHSASSSPFEQSTSSPFEQSHQTPFEQVTPTSFASSQSSPFHQPAAATVAHDAENHFAESAEGPFGHANGAHNHAPPMVSAAGLFDQSYSGSTEVFASPAEQNPSPPQENDFVEAPAVSAPKSTGSAAAGLFSSPSIDHGAASRGPFDQSPRSHSAPLTVSPPPPVPISSGRNVQDPELSEALGTLHISQPPSQRSQHEAPRSSRGASSTLDDTIRLAEMYKQMAERLQTEKNDLLKVLADQTEQFYQMQDYINSLEREVEEYRSKDIVGGH